MSNGAGLSSFFYEALEEEKIVYVQTSANSVFGKVITVYTDGVKIDRLNGLMAVITFNNIIIAEDITSN